MKMYDLDNYTLLQPQFVIFASGFLSLSSQHARYTELRLLSTPSLHIFGTGDEVVLCPVGNFIATTFVLLSWKLCCAQSVKLTGL